MRAYLAPAMIGIGSMLASFAAVVFILEIFASRSDPEHRVRAMSALGVEMVVAGGVLIALGLLLNRLGSRRPA